MVCGFRKIMRTCVKKKSNQKMIIKYRMMEKIASKMTKKKGKVKSKEKMRSSKFKFMTK